jgi:hypothetical protein
MKKAGADDTDDRKSFEINKAIFGFGNFQTPSKAIVT